jgi:cell division septation protein DedD
MNRHARINRRKDKHQMKTNADATTTTEAAAVAEQGATTAPEQATTKGKASKTKGAPKAKKTTSKPAASKKASKKAAKPAAKKTPKAATPREGSKKQIVLGLLRRKDGATMAEIAKATDWQNHSIRGFISGNLTKKMGLVVESSKNEAGERTYRIASK